MANFTPADVVLALLDRYGTGFRPKDDPFFMEGNFYNKKFVKLGVLSEISQNDNDDEQQHET